MSFFFSVCFCDQKGLQNTAQLQPLLSEASSRTTVDGGQNGHSNGFITRPVNGFVKASAEDPLEAFQYSDDDDADYIPSAVVKEELFVADNELIEEEEIRPPPKRRSARSRKPVKSVQYEDNDFDE